MISRFFILTRGRTGSTAIIDEINKVKGVYAVQELFIKRDFQTLIKEDQVLEYQSTIPFELWKLKLSLLQKILRRLSTERRTERRLINKYLTQMEDIAQQKGITSFGFKVLSHHISETPFLKEILIDKGYRAIYLTRNIPRQVISGMIAKQRGVYNRQDYEDNRRYQINVDEFEELVRYEILGVDNDIDLLKSCGFNLIQVSYEEFLNDRSMFFNRILNYIGVNYEEPQASAYSVMIKDLRYTVENFDAVIDRVLALGMTIEGI